MRRWCRRLAQAAAAAMALGMALVAGIALRLVAGPIAVPALPPRLERALSGDDGSVHDIAHRHRAGVDRAPSGRSGERAETHRDLGRRGNGRCDGRSAALAPRRRGPAGGAHGGGGDARWRLSARGRRRRAGRRGAARAARRDAGAHRACAAPCRGSRRVRWSRAARAALPPSGSSSGQGAGASEVLLLG